MAAASACCWRRTATSRLPFEVLPDAEGHPLLGQYTIGYLSCGWDVLRFAAAPRGQPTEPLVVADPLFDLAADADASAPATDRRRAETMQPMTRRTGARIDV